MFSITAIGEILIDFTPGGTDSKGNLLFVRNPGGAPANVLAMASKLGGKTAFIGKIGKDRFGLFLKKILEDNDIDTEGLVIDENYHTTLAFVELNEEGDRSFSFYRTEGADIMLTGEEVNKRNIDDCRIFHFGSVSLTDNPSKGAVQEAVSYAKKKGKLISFDPNYRPLL